MPSSEFWLHHVEKQAVDLRPRWGYSTRIEGSYEGTRLERYDMIKKTLLALALLGMLIAAASCNTMRGLGRDVSIAGDAITEAAGGAP